MSTITRAPSLLAVVAAAVACALTGACSDTTTPRRSSSDLLPFEVPEFDDHLEETRYIWAQVNRYIRYMARNDDRNFDSFNHVVSQFNALTTDLRKIDFPPSDVATVEKALAPSPEIMHYRGARQNAVALGLIAVAIWQRDPHRKRVTIEELNICAGWKSRRRCQLTPRTRALHRMMLMAEYADADLFHTLRRQMPPPRRPASP